MRAFPISFASRIRPELCCSETAVSSWPYSIHLGIRVHLIRVSVCVILICEYPSNISAALSRTTFGKALPHSVCRSQLTPAVSVLPSSGNTLQPTLILHSWSIIRCKGIKSSRGLVFVNIEQVADVWLNRLEGNVQSKKSISTLALWVKHLLLDTSLRKKELDRLGKSQNQRSAVAS